MIIARYDSIAMIHRFIEMFTSIIRANIPDVARVCVFVIMSTGSTECGGIKQE